jgi:hypothetical protein
MSRSIRRKREAAACCLLESVRGLLERTYLLRSGLEHLDRFIVGDRGYLLLYGSPDGVGMAGANAAEGAKTLVRESADGLRASIYFPDVQIRLLERYPPQSGLCDENVDAFGALVEELDHLLVIAERSRQQRAVTLFELELHANVSRHLVLTRFLAGRAERLGSEKRLWLRSRLFGAVQFCDEDRAVRERYRSAMRWAVQFIDGLSALESQARIGLLRRFHTAPAAEKLRLIRARPT